MITTLSLKLAELEPLAARAMHASLIAVATVENSFLKSLAAALDHALNRKIDSTKPAPVYSGHLQTLSDLQVGQVISTFDCFCLSFETLGFTNAVKFCDSVREFARAELLERLSTVNPPGRFTPTLN